MDMTTRNTPINKKALVKVNVSIVSVDQKVAITAWIICQFLECEDCGWHVTGTINNTFNFGRRKWKVQTLTKSVHSYTEGHVGTTHGAELEYSIEILDRTAESNTIYGLLMAK